MYVIKGLMLWGGEKEKEEEEKKEKEEQKEEEKGVEKSLLVSVWPV